VPWRLWPFSVPALRRPRVRVHSGKPNKNFIDDLFTETLNEALGKEAVENGKKTIMVESKLMHDAEWLLKGFESEDIYSIETIISYCD
jgi:hypothetical protein